MQSNNSWAARISVLLATCGGVGFSPVAPGTLGAALGVPLAYSMTWLSPGPYWLTLIGLFLVGFPMCDAAAKALKKEDPGEVIWDELATVPITFMFVPVASMSLPWVLFAGFALHRFFDILKIAPANKMEQLHGGTGIMMDDLVAGIYSCGVLHALLFAVSKF